MKTDILTYIIIGAGPAGLTLAYCLGKLEQKVILIDREADVGGCHRVRRVDGLFSEHGPRIYVSNFNTLKMLLEKWDVQFDSVFTPYNFNISNIGGESIKHFYLRELLILAWYYFRFIISKNWAKQMQMEDLVTKHNFSKTTIDYIDRLCRLTDGGSISRYTVYEFFHLPNQNILYSIYQPILPNDVGLFKLWKEKLKETGNVELILNAEVVGLKGDSNKIKEVFIKSEGKQLIYKADKVILAIPPENIVDILQRSGPIYQNAFGSYHSIKAFAGANNYSLYIPICFHWSKKLVLPKIWGFPKTSWGIAFITLSDYMTFAESESKTVISTAITIPEGVSEKLGKTAHQCNKQELIQEVFRQLKLSYPNLPNYSKAIVSPEIYFKDKQWRTNDKAYFFTTNEKMNQKSKDIINLYNCGTHNGLADYAFTSMESAMANALELLYLLEPRSDKIYQRKRIWTINEVIGLFLLVLIIGILFILKIIN